MRPGGSTVRHPAGAGAEHELTQCQNEPWLSLDEAIPGPCEDGSHADAPGDCGPPGRRQSRAGRHTDQKRLDPQVFAQQSFQGPTIDEFDAAGAGGERVAARSEPTGGDQDAPDEIFGTGKVSPFP